MFYPPFSFPGSAAGNLEPTLSILNVEREYPYSSKGRPAEAHRGGWFWENLILIFKCSFSRRFPRPTQNHGGNDRKRRTRRRLHIRSAAGSIFPHNKLQARLSNSRACYFCSKYLEKSCITLDISDNSLTSYSFNAFIIRAISISRSVAGEVPLILFFSEVAPSR